MSDSATPGMAWEDIAQSAYRAYAASTGNKNFRGDPMPEWPDLPQSIRVAWEAAARKVGDCLWMPPQSMPPQPTMPPVSAAEVIAAQAVRQAAAKRAEREDWPGEGMDC